MITIYEKSATSFLNNGYGVLRDFYSNPLITEELNGSFYLEFEYVKDGWLSEYLIEENIIKANGQPFRICTIKKTLKSIKILAKHIAFDLNKNFLEDVFPRDLSGASALEWILTHTQYEHNFTSFSDITTVNSARYVRKNVMEALISADNSLIKVWNGELYYDNYLISLLNHRGENRGLTVRYGKNLNGVECNIDFSTVATRIMPKGADGLLITEKYIDSDLIDNYNSPIIKVIEFSKIGITDEIDEATAMNMLRNEVAKLYEAGIDLPKTSIKVDFIELSKVKEYENYSNLESVYLGDTINFVIEPLNLNLSTRVVSITYDCLLERNVKLELGTVTPNFINQQTKNLNELKSAIETINPTNILTQAKTEATTLLRQPFSGYTYFDDLGNFYIMDTTDIITAEKLWKFGLGGIGYSSTGINGTYTTAITSDGKIVADFVITGVLDGILLKGNSVTADKIDTSTFKTGGDNIPKDSTGIYNNGSWDGDVVSYIDTETKQNTDSQNVIYMQNNIRKQIIQCQNGIYSISFKYKKLITLANPKIKINGYEILLDSEIWKKENYTFEILSNTIEIEFSSDTDNSCWLGDLVCRSGSIAGVWSSAPGESNYGGVKISNFIEVDSTTANTKTTMDNEGFRTHNKTTDEVVMEATDKGGKFKHIEATSSKTGGILRQKVSATQTWDTWVG